MFQAIKSNMEDGKAEIECLAFVVFKKAMIVAYQKDNEPTSGRGTKQR